MSETPKFGSAANDKTPSGSSSAKSRVEVVTVDLTVNGQPRTMTIEPRTTLLDALRENLALTGTKKACDRGECGACTVHIDGRRVLSCMTLAAMQEGKRIMTRFTLGEKLLDAVFRFFKVLRLIGDPPHVLHAFRDAAHGHPPMRGHGRANIEPPRRDVKSFGSVRFGLTDPRSRSALFQGSGIRSFDNRRNRVLNLLPHSYVQASTLSM